MQLDLKVLQISQAQQYNTALLTFTYDPRAFKAFKAWRDVSNSLKVVWTMLNLHSIGTKWCPRSIR